MNKLAAYEIALALNEMQKEAFIQRIGKAVGEGMGSVGAKVSQNARAAMQATGRGSKRGKAGAALENISDAIAGSANAQKAIGAGVVGTGVLGTGLVGKKVLGGKKEQQQG